MRIHGICLVKDEEDVIRYTLSKAIEWCDYIYVLDNGSTDSSWEIVLSLAKEKKQVVPFKQDFQPFRDSLRADVFDAYRNRSSEGDWWCVLDADEVYIDNPKIFLPNVPKQFSVIRSASLQYYFTDKDFDRYTQNPSLYADEVPVEEKCSYYINNWSESRFFRYSPSLEWKNIKPTGAIYPVRIRLKHYQYRSPNQIKKRLENRRKARLAALSLQDERQSYLFSHEADITDWKKKIVKASELYYDALDGNYILREDLMQSIPNNRPSVLNLAKRIHAKLAIGLESFKLLKR